MSPQPRLSKVPLWQRHVETVLATLRDALILLNDAGVVGQEPEISRELYDHLLIANRKRHDQGLRALDVPIIWEARNPPSPETKGTSSERKIPDFQCGYMDHQADVLRSTLYLIIECKKLGYPTRAKWTFNKNYIDEGINRFVDPAYRYGKDVADGAMVGYIESMALEDLVTEVNTGAAAANLPALVRCAGGGGPLHEFKHALNRDFPITPFTLWHLWIEMTTASTDDPTPGEL